MAAKPGASGSENGEAVGTASTLDFLSEAEVGMIDALLAQVGPYGDVRLLIEGGRLASVAVTVSHDALKAGKVRRFRVEDLKGLEAS